MSLEIKNLVINVHVTGSSEEKQQEALESLRSELLEKCRDMVRDSFEKEKER